MSWLGKLFKPAGSGVSTDAPRPRTDAPQRAAGTSPRDEARNFLSAELATGSVPAEELLRRARKFGHAEKTLRRAKADLGIQAYRVGHGCEQRWFWTLALWPSEVANSGVPEMVPPALAISSETEGRTDGEGLFHEMATAATQAVADDSQNGETPNGASCFGQVPAGFTIPPGVQCVGWDLRSTPLKLDRGVTVLNAEDFVKTHLEILAAKLRGDNGWLYEQWSLATLLADLKDLGVELRIP